MKKQVGIAILTLAAGLQFASAGDITGTVTLKGEPAPEKEIGLDPACGKIHAGGMKTRFYAVGANKGLADTVVYLKGISGKSTGASAQPLAIDQKGCEYLPYVAAAQTSQKIMVKNSDNVMHNVHPTPTATGNKEENKAHMPGMADLTFNFPTAEMFLRFKCDVHPWMFSYISVFDHPYFAVTDKDGNFKIANVPAGKYTVVAAHRKGAMPGLEKEIEVKDSAKVDFTIDAK
jgi:hypothetical protein